MKLAALVVMTALSLPSAARAFSGAPGHADISVKPIHKTVNGVKCVTGCVVKFKVRNTGSSAYQPAKFARAGIYREGVVATIGSSDADRNSTFDLGPTAKFFHHEDIPVEAQETVYDGKVTIDYAKHGVQSGQKLTLVTAWKYNPSGAPHVYGAVMQRDANNDFVTP